MNPNRIFPWGDHTAVMGILNLTPDSFSGDGLLARADPVASAVEQAWRSISAGVDILDIGGESTRPGAQPVPAAEEIRRILPVIEALADRPAHVILSVDTYKAETAQAALAAGADWINDVWALRADPRMAEVAARSGAPVILMHNRSRAGEILFDSTLGGEYRGADYADLLGEVKAELLEAVRRALQAGITKDRIILDPGLGFGKSVQQNLELINRLDEVKALGFPLLSGPSRKSFIGKTLQTTVDRRLEGTEAAVVVSILRGADIVRVHDVEAMVPLVRMTDAILKAGRPER
jgi:dihydropteroate synthase